MFGNLTFADFDHGPIVLGAQILISVLALGVIFLLFYLKRWRWLWDEWLTSLDPKKIGVMYIAVATIMLVRGLIDASMMRLQQALAASDPGYLDPHHFSQIFTAHGVIMIFFVAMPFMFGLLNLVVPLQIGARDVAFPFLNSLAFWLFAAGAMLVNASLVVGEFAATGWLAYPPLSELQYSPSVGVDYFIWALQISGVGSLLSGINFFVTIIKMRAPGMTLFRMPIFEWTALGSMFLVIFAFPVLTATLGMLFLDRFFGMHFFTTDGGGNLMMYINLIWTWGHPEVYILILPAFGVFSEVVATFSRKRLFGYNSMVAATLAITILSFVVWLHHFFTMGAGANVNAFFGIMTMIIAVPTGVKMFNWIFTMYRGRVTFASPMLWFIGFVITFTVGGMTGVLLSVPGADFQLHNSLFLVAHFHNMIIGGVLFGYFAGLTFWFPKIFGFTLNERWGKNAFWLWITGFLFAFIPLYALGFMGMTRRLSEYDAGTGWQPLLILAGIGVVIIVCGVIAQLIQLYVSIRDRKENMSRANDPWDGRTLEWSTVSPAPFYNFAATPKVYGKDAYFAEKQLHASERPQPVIEDILLPKNSAFGLYIGGVSFALSFALIWHIMWFIPVGVLAIIVLVIIRSVDQDYEYVVPKEEILKIERELANQ